MSPEGGWPDPGQPEAQRAVRAALRRQALPTALLISGPSGVGQREFAEWIAALRWCLEADEERRPCGGCVPCRKLSSGNHPDLDVLRRDPPAAEDPESLGSRHEITIDQVRRGLLPRLALRASEGRGRTVLIDEADRLNEAAQNALLKTLEEPPAGCVLLLLVAHEDALLDTVRSRCQRLRLAPLQTELLAARAPQADADRLALAGGRPGRLAELLALDVPALHALLEELLGGRLPGAVFARRVQDLVAASVADDDGADETARHRLAADVLAARLVQRAAEAPAGDPRAAARALFGLAADLRRHVPPAVAWTAVGVELSASRGGH